MFVLGEAIGPAAAAALKRREAGSGERHPAQLGDPDALAAEFPRLGARIKSGAAEHGGSPADRFESG